ncbi:DEKNAAC102561 [Brettanomyces naardenensis]|uniref:protein-tyrosine-phosphatase n=1 Tax=Brettanomyces naardenensis TaxID=13370 RepID=A0A448YKV3_BRENA|nr:DEKNAAC102561 [Brettanomyces naardenensis]
MSYRSHQESSPGNASHHKKMSDASSVVSDSSTLVEDGSLNGKLGQQPSDNRSISTLAITEETEDENESQDNCDAQNGIPTSSPYHGRTYKFSRSVFGHRSIKSESALKNRGTGGTSPQLRRVSGQPLPTSATEQRFPKGVNRCGSPGTMKSPSFNNLNSPFSLRFKTLGSSAESLPARVGRFKESRTPLPEGSEILSQGVCAEQIQQHRRGMRDDILVVDVRPFQEYCKAHIDGAVNICLPSTLLRRANFTLEKCIQTLAVDEKGLFSKYLGENMGDTPTVIFYDNSTCSADSASCSVSNLTSKFTKCPNWTSQLFVLEGGLTEFGKEFPDLLSSGTSPSAEFATPLQNSTPINTAVPPLTPTSPERTPKPVSKSYTSGAAKDACRYSRPSHGLSHFTLPETVHLPFYKMRHQEELLTSRPDSTLHLSTSLSNLQMNGLPKWLSNIFGPDHGATELSRKFNRLQIEERNRLNQAMSRGMHSESFSSAVSPATPIVAAGFELGRKNRYKDIFPYEHARVKIRKYGNGGADLDQEGSYINASYLRYPVSDFNYIATQGPLMETIGDFWRVICDHNVPLVFSLTAQKENQVEKCAPYWNAGTYNSDGIRVQVDLIESVENFKLMEGCEGDTIVRRFEVRIGEKPPHQILQVHMLSWVDYGAAVKAEELLSLVALKRLLLQQTGTEKAPVLVHCSAGCGRTGCFCTIDTCIDLLLNGKESSLRIGGQERDLVYDIISKFRSQRVSMVQNLRQYILIYDTILTFIKSRLLGHGGDSLRDWRDHGSYDILTHFVEGYNNSSTV